MRHICCTCRSLYPAGGCSKRLRNPFCRRTRNIVQTPYKRNPRTCPTGLFLSWKNIVSLLGIASKRNSHKADTEARPDVLKCRPNGLWRQKLCRPAGGRLVQDMRFQDEGMEGLRPHSSVRISRVQPGPSWRQHHNSGHCSTGRSDWSTRCAS